MLNENQIWNRHAAVYLRGFLETPFNCCANSWNNITRIIAFHFWISHSAESFGVTQSARKMNYDPQNYLEIFISIRLQTPTNCHYEMILPLRGRCEIVPLEISRIFHFRFDFHCSSERFGRKGRPSTKQHEEACVCKTFFSSKIRFILHKRNGKSFRLQLFFAWNWSDPK